VNEFPLCYEVEEFMREERLDILDVIRYLGEEYSILFASSDEQKYNVLGTIVQGEGITFRKAKIMAGGWDNFKGFIT
jgi:thiamine monophosphate kinase